MTRKLMVLGLAAVLVVAVAIPVVAQERAVTPKLQKISKRALKKSATALRTAREANRRAREAQALAAGASAAAGEAKAGAAKAGATLESSRVQSGFAPDGVEVSSEAFVARPGGPTVTVAVPPSGLIEVWAQARVFGEGAVSLFEDGKPLSGQTTFCSPDEDTGVLFAVSAEAGEPITVATPAAGGIAICGSLGAPGPVLFQTTPGTHTYELRYASCGCEDPAEAAGFTERRLFVAPRP
ncbi:MAG TPA: hypothetical protein VFT79_00275 [Solirubrobacterales bacterium]|nr:hypothetical protein [Solirubrobacterales bacterium]